MSKRQAKKFIEALEHSAALRKQVNRASEDIVKVARRAGFKVTRAEVAEALKAHWFEAAEQGQAIKDLLKFVLSETPAL
jgi:predicted ribosomally synthesized peptide with nif11-like leader